MIISKLLQQLMHSKFIPPPIPLNGHSIFAFVAVLCREPESAVCANLHSYIVAL